MAIKISGNTIIDDSRNITNAKLATVENLTFTVAENSGVIDKVAHLNASNQDLEIKVNNTTAVSAQFDDLGNHHGRLHYAGASKIDATSLGAAISNDLILEVSQDTGYVGTLEGSPNLEIFAGGFSNPLELASNGNLQVNGQLTVQGGDIQVEGGTAIDNNRNFFVGAGNTAARPTGVTGAFRFNTDTGSFEGYDGSAWGSVGGASGGNIQYFTEDPGSGWVKYDGSVVLQSSYPSIFSKWGLIYDLMNTWSSSNLASLPGRPFSAAMYDISYSSSSGRYLLVGENGYASTSTDFYTWSTTTPNPGRALYAAEYHSASGLYLVGGQSGDFFTSTNAITWTQRTIFSGQNIRDFAINQSSGLLVAVGSSGSVATSTNAITWTVRTTPGGGSPSFKAAEYASSLGLFAIASTNFPPYIYTSPDGITWTTRSSANPGSDIYDIATNGSLFIATGNSDKIYRSTNGITWTNTTSGLGGSWIGVEYGNGEFFLIASETGKAATTTDGLTFTTTTSMLGTSTSNEIGLTYNGSTGKYAYVSDFSQSIGQFTGFNDFIGLNTSYVAESFVYNFNTGAYLIAGNAGAVFTTTAFSSWTKIGDIGHYSRGIIFGNGPLYVAHGDKGAISTSTNGITWTARTSGTTDILFKGAWGNGLFFIGDGNGNNVYTSTNGITWTARSVGLTYTTYGAAYGNGKYAVSDYYGYVVSSTDAVTWTRSSTGWSLLDLSFGNGYFVGAGNNGNVYYSTDAITWSNSRAMSPQIYSVEYVNGLWIAVGQGGGLSTSTDLVSWATRTAPTSNTLRNVFYDSNIGNFGYMSLSGTSSNYVYLSQGVSYNTATEFALPTVEPLVSLDGITIADAYDQI